MELAAQAAEDPGVVAGLHLAVECLPHGSKNVLCVNTLPGATNTEDRCKGIADAIAKSGGKSTQLPLPSSSFGNPTAVAEAIKAAVLKDNTIDGVITISAGDANSAANAISQANAGDKVKLASFDMALTYAPRTKLRARR